MAADGTLIFDTRMDPDGFEKGAADISKNLGKFTSKLKSLGKELNSAFNGSKVIDLQNKIKDTEEKISLLKRELSEIGDTPIKSSALKSLERNIEKTKTKLQELYAQADQIGNAKLADMNDLGLQVDDNAFEAMLSNDTSWKKIQQQISETESKLDGYKQKLKEVQAAENSDPKSTIAYQKKQNQIDSLERKLNSYKAKLSETAQAETKASNAGSKAAKSTKSVGSSMSKAASQTNVFAKSLKRIQRLLASMLLYKAVAAVFGGIKEGMQNLAQVSPEVNSNLSELMSALTQMKNSLATAFAPILSVVTPILTKFINLISTAATYVGQFFAALSGAKTFKKAVTVQQDYADSLKNTDKQAKKTQKSLASFDGLNILSDNSEDSNSTSSSTVSPETMFVDVKINSNISEFAKRFKRMMQPVIKNAKNLWDALKPLRDFSSKAMSDFYKNCLTPIGNWVVGVGLPRFVEITKEMVKNIDWTKLQGSLNTLWTSIARFATHIIGEGLLWFYENVLAPLAEWTISDLLPAFLDLLAQVIDTLGTVIDAMAPTFEWFWENVLSPFAEWTGGIIVSVIEKLTEKLSDFSEWAKNNQAAMDMMAFLIIGFFAGIIFYYSTKKIIDVVKSIREAFSNFTSVIATSGFKLAFAAAAFGILAAGIIYLAKNWDKLSPAQRVITILGGLAAAATAAAVAIALFHTAWSVGVAAAAIAGGLAVLGLTYVFSKGSTDTADTAFDSANDFYSSYDFSGSGYNFPKLATGTVVPANYGEFLAVLGDNKNETEVVSPLSTMKQAFLEALNESGNTGGAGTINLNVLLDGSKIYSTVVKLNNANKRRTGKNALA